MPLVAKENTVNSISFKQRQFELEKAKEIEEKAEKLAKNSPFSRWTQFNLEHTRELMWLAIKYPKAHAVLYFLVDQMDEYNAVICSTKVLEDVLGVSRQTISKSIKVLKDNGFIAVLKSGTSNVYTINDKVYWKTWGNKKQYSKFPANVVLSLEEQDNEQQLDFKNLGYTRVKEVVKK